MLFVHVFTTVLDLLQKIKVLKISLRIGQKILKGWRKGSVFAKSVNFYTEHWVKLNKTIFSLEEWEQELYQ